MSNYIQLRATMTYRGRYYHEHCMAIMVDRDSPVGQNMTADAEDAVSEALRDLARWLYRQLEREYDYLSSDDVVDEAIVFPRVAALASIISHVGTPVAPMCSAAIPRTSRA